MKSDVTIKQLIDAGVLSPGQLLECHCVKDRTIHNATLGEDGSIGDSEKRTFNDPTEWAKHLGHKTSGNGWDEVKCVGGSSLEILKKRLSVNSDEDGIEPEEEGETEIKKPFDPEKINIDQKPILITQLVSRMKRNEIQKPEFQRKAGIWNDRRKSRLIESLLLRIPIPVFYFAADLNDDWAVVDGLQRTTSIYEFVSGKFKLKDLEYLVDHNGKFYSTLSRPMQRRIDETTLSVNIIQSGTPEEVTFNIFSRINTGGMTLTGQEIRHALHKGPVLGFLRDLAETSAFLGATQKSVNPERMADRECVLRFLAFYHRRWETYGSRDDLDRWLSTTMHEINNMSDHERGGLRQAFERSMRTAHQLFDDYAFRKRYSMDDRKRPINKALFEVWSVGIARCSRIEQESLVKKRRAVNEAFFSLMENSEFEAAVSIGTGDRKRVRLRFGEVEKLIQGCLSC